MTDDIVTFIRARLEEDQDADWHARTCQTHQTMPPGTPFGLAGSPMSCNCGVPDQVSRGVEAKRRLVDDLLAQEHVSNDRDWYGCQSLKEGHGDGPDVPTGRPCTCGRDEDVGRRLRLIALEWSTHEDYRSEWT